ncbi:MAG: hypothetical protein CMJ51_05690 [Planctomycetaceae bacterium]|nr:hypothetical protein [Planctomycetaceae bacterium]
MLVSDDTGEMRNSPPSRRPFHIFLLLPMLIGGLGPIGGCDDAFARDQNAAILALDRGDDRTALEDARRLVRSAPVSKRPEAGYIGGIAAYRLGDFAEALDLLEQAIQAEDPDLRGRAFIQRGTVQQKIGRRREAARSFERGGLLVRSGLGAEALLRAADSYKEVGLEVDARRCLDDARRMGGQDVTEGRLAGYAIQFGAYSSRANAEKCARNVAAAVRAAGAGDVMLVEQGGLYKVQVGCYSNITQAGRAMRRIRQPSTYLATITAIGD